MSETFENEAIELEKLVLRARQALGDGDSENAEKYYWQVYKRCPEYWEGLFFTGVFEAESCLIADIVSAATAFQECIKKTFAAIQCLKDTEEQDAAIEVVISVSVEISQAYTSNVLDVYRRFSSEPTAFQDTADRIVASDGIYETIGTILSEFKGKEQLAADFAKEYLQVLADHEKWRTTYAAAYNRAYFREVVRKKYPNYTPPEAKKEGCYVATCVYGSYDCPEVWTLRRYRDNTLASTWYGRGFIRTYYAISPTLVKWFGNTQWFKKLWKTKLDRMVSKLQSKGVEDTPYQDKKW